MALLVICAVELSRDCLPMGSHWRPWQGGGPVRAGLGWLMLPGWPSAALFAAVALGLQAVSAILLPSWGPPGASLLHKLWWLTLAWQALVFPALLLSFLPSGSSMRMGGSGYFVVQGLFGTVSLLSTSNSVGILASEHFARTLDALCQVLPVSSFWLVTGAMKESISGPTLTGQFISLVVLIGLAWRQSRIYRGTLARFNARPAGAATVAP